MSTKVSLTLTAGLLCTLLFSTNAKAQEPNLFFSEYIEGSSNNKAIEIYNPTSLEINLEGYSVEIYSNGSSTASNTIVLPDSALSPGQAYVVCHTSFSSPNLCDQLSGSLNHNGNDALVLRDSEGNVLDNIGQTGFDPGTQWIASEVSTLNQTLRRKCGINYGDQVDSDAFDPSQQWNNYPQDFFDDLGMHTALCEDEKPTTTPTPTLTPTPTPTTTPTPSSPETIAGSIFNNFNFSGMKDMVTKHKFTLRNWLTNLPERPKAPLPFPKLPDFKPNRLPHTR